MIRNTLLVAAVSLLSAANAAKVEQWWNVGWVENQNPDGLPARRVIGVNGTWPPPILNINSSDSLTIHVKNQLNDGMGTALHSHGMFFNGTGYYDGAVGITQCPIPPNESFSYEVHNSPKSPAEAAKQWGTFWTHGHSMGQYVDGLRTASIIHADTAETQAHKYDEDYTILMADWYHATHDILMEQFMTDRNPTGAEPIPDSSVIYFAHTSNNSATPTLVPGFNEDAKLQFQPSKTYRLRLINMSALAMFQFWIDGHEMRIIEADGVDTQEFPIDRISLSVAQRYSILVTAKNTTDTNYGMHINMDPVMFDTVPDSLKLNVTSLIEYNDKAGTPVAAEETRDYDDMIDDTLLVPYYPEPSYPADTSHDLNVWFDVRADGKNYAAFNNISFVFPETPSLLTQTTMGSAALEPAAYGPSSHAIVTKHGDMVELTIYNWDANAHPFHLHGHQFQIVKKTMDALSDDPTVNPPLNETALSLGNPMRRDTVTVPSGGAAVLRFRSDNPGAWLMHCHIEFHLNAGLALIMIEAPEVVNSKLQIDPAVQRHCLADNIAVTGNAAGLNSTTDFGNLKKEAKFIISGWTKEAVGSVVGCAITAALGLAVVVYFGLSQGEEQEDKE
ncbi:putative Fer1-iron transport multicopper oxidase [Jaminaea rosea]|uniref:Putative Fer1-iron transport multicopper oxidase n=1 Tax=Jaminaea rosea TaxID=1569628 RepID=A0A316UML0_9BASI|nr:putative Fer1-iron transport multicopper oxidase [Jaminaea rosea]PWN26507.1 putative Fer1-iron transport multicopper oxidase [Jaminaea rosea]